MTIETTISGWCSKCGQNQVYKVIKGTDNVVAWDSSHVVARGSSHVVARGSSHVVARDSSHVEARSPYASCCVKSSMAVVPVSAVGGKSLSALEWLVACGVEIKRGSVILYKSVNKDFTTRNGICFKPKTKHVAPDWDADYKEECGKGIHYCPTVAQAKTFRDEGVYIACEVKVADMAGLPAFAEHPEKIRAKGGKVLYQVDAEGNKLRQKKEEAHNG